MTYPASSPLPAEPRLLQRKQREPHPPGPPWSTALPTFPLGVAHACVLAISLRSTKRS